MKFSLAIAKFSAADVGRAAGHNLRTHPTASQLPEKSWFSKEKIWVSEGYEFRHEVVEKAKSLAKRKDAVVAISLVFQVGRQEDWRDAPTLEFPEGKVKKAPAPPKAILNAARRSLIKEFGEENIVSVVMHLDETSPHVQCVVVPIIDGKLQAKHWLDGAARCAQLLERVHREFSKTVPCTYEKNSKRGGEPHDVRKAAGGIHARHPEPGLADKLIDALSQRKEADELKKRILSLENDVSLAFSAQKQTIFELNREKLISSDLVEQLRSAKKMIQTQRAEINDLRDQVVDLEPEPTPAPEPTPTRPAQPRPSPSF